MRSALFAMYKDGRSLLDFTDDPCYNNMIYYAKKGKLSMQHRGKVFVIEGLDGCGKSTQLPLVSEALAQRGIRNRAISYPNYDDPSSALVQLYLSGAFGSAADAVNPYAASSFYAVDRFASFCQYWQQDYETGMAILAGRYVTSNAIYQMNKLPKSEWDGYLQWLSEYEYDKLKLPRPDRVVFLDMPLELSQRLLMERYHGMEQKKDIHERDLTFLAACREAALFAAQRQGWVILPCADAHGLLPREDMTLHIVDALCMDNTDAVL